MSNLQAEVEYTTAIVCVERDDLNVSLIYSDVTKNTVTVTKPYVNDTTDSFILSSIQPGATIYYTLQVIDADSNTVGSARNGSLVFLPSSSPMPSSVMSTTTTGMRIFILLYLTHTV